MKFVFIILLVSAVTACSTSNKASRSGNNSQSSPPTYSISQKLNIDRVSVVQRSETGNSIQILFKRHGTDSKRSVSNLMLQGSSGNNTTDMLHSFMGFSNVNFPFTGSVNYNIPNDFNTNSLDCELNFTINKPGLWVITIVNQ